MNKFILYLALLASLAACGHGPGTRALTGGALGAGAGAVVGSTTGVGVVPAAVVGGVAGAAVGIVTTPLSW